ncbi:DUF5302 domain-containing protein [Thermocrispum municipale]|jgi:hypothetical protein|uniref:DUF5302 domain-containing protein n=1 Tax=Thermocrispum municipale TaxID=37926 RepID=UPI000410EB75|nr:DUF5302 domain-containing protein [Thermocrispum municipale]
MTESKSGSDDVKDRFREALERKRAATKERESHADGGAKSVHPHGPLGGKRQFRRKSG